jgi:hypothetical protein
MEAIGGGAANTQIPKTAYGLEQSQAQRSSAQAALDAAAALQSVLHENLNAGDQEQQRAMVHAQQVQQLTQQQAERHARLQILQQQAAVQEQAQQRAKHAEEQILLQQQAVAQQQATLQRQAQQREQLKALQQAQHALDVEQKSQEQALQKARTAAAPPPPMSPLRVAVMEAEASLKFALEQRNKQAAAAAQEASAHAQNLMQAQSLAAGGWSAEEPTAVPATRRRKRVTRQPASYVATAAAAGATVAEDWSRRQRVVRSQTVAGVAGHEEERKSKEKIARLKLRLAGQKQCIDELQSQLKTKHKVRSVSARV